MKLYLWTNVLTDWNSGKMFAIANSVEEARALLRATCKYIPEDDLAKEPEEHLLDKPFADFVWGSA